MTLNALASIYTINIFTSMSDPRGTAKAFFEPPVQVL